MMRFTVISRNAIVYFVCDVQPTEGFEQSARISSSPAIRVYVTFVTCLHVVYLDIIECNALRGNQ